MGRRVNQLGVAALTGVALLPLAVLAVRVVATGDDYRPHSDLALIELNTRDVGEHAVLLGPYSRFGWSHPGPLLYLVLAIPYRLLGERSMALVLGSLAVAAAAVLGMAFIAYRRGGLGFLAVTVLVMGLVVHGLGTEILLQFWNPYITILPLALLLFLAWEMASGGRWALPVAAAVGSFLVQSHLGYAVPALAVLAVGVAGLARSAPLSAIVRPLAVAVGVGVLLWMPPVVEAVRHRGGNVADIVDFYGERHRGGDLADGLRVARNQLAARPDWLDVGSRPPAFATGVHLVGEAPWPWALVPFLAAVFVAWRRRRRQLLWLAAVVSAALVAVVLAVANIVEDVFDYLVHWTRIPGAAVWVVVGFVVIDAAGRRVGRWLVPVVAVAAAVVGLVTAFGLRDADPRREDAELEAELASTTRARLDEGQLVLMRPSGFPYAEGLALHLEKTGVDVAVEPGQGAAFGRHRERRTDPDVVLSVLTVRGFDAVRAPARSVRVARVGERPEAERATLVRQAAEVRRRHRAGRLSDGELIEQLTRIPDPGVEVVVVAERGVPPD